jgi:hypothetical protein
MFQKEWFWKWFKSVIAKIENPHGYVVLNVLRQKKTSKCHQVKYYKNFCSSLALQTNKLECLAFVRLFSLDYYMRVNIVYILCSKCILVVIFRNIKLLKSLAKEKRSSLFRPKRRRRREREKFCNNATSHKQKTSYGKWCKLNAADKTN